MAINKNHEFDDLEGVKCAIVEKNASKERSDFLKQLLELNGYTVVTVPSPPPKAATTSTEEGAPPAVPLTFTVGVTDVTFNPINAVYGRLLKTVNGHIVTAKYWQQKEVVSHDEVPYYEHD